MTLESKLRALVAELKPLLEKATPRPWSTNSRFRPSSSAKVLVGSDLRSIAYVGMNPQSKDWEIHAQDITNATLIVAAVNAVSQLEALLAATAEEGQSVAREMAELLARYDKGLRAESLLAERQEPPATTEAERVLCEAALVWFLTPEVLDDYEALKDTESHSAPAEFMLLCEIAKDVLGERVAAQPSSGTGEKE